MAKRKKKPELKVVFDTNVIYSGTASYLINIEAAEIIKNNLSHHDLNIVWHLPETVVKEREFQMIKKGIELLEPVNKLETLLGHNLNITEEIIEERVKSVIAKQLEDNSLSISKLHIESIDWYSLINCSLKRIPPFEDNKSEKGFRDSLILESFDQLVKESPKTPSSCRIAFVCNDKKLMDAVKERTKDSNNIRYLTDLTSLKGLINILVSEIEEKLINDIADKATELFFIPKNHDTIYYKENIRTILEEKYKEELTKLPDTTASAVNEGTWYISKVNFIKKEKQRIWWSSPVNVTLKAFKREYRRISDFEDTNSPTTGIGLINSLSGLTTPSWETYQGMNNPMRDILNRPRLVEYMEGKSKYEIIWSVTYTANKKFLNPKIEEINFLGNEWEKE